MFLFYKLYFLSYLHSNFIVMFSSPCFVSLITSNIIILFYNLSKFVPLFGDLGSLMNNLTALWVFYSTYKIGKLFHVQSYSTDWLLGFFFFNFLLLFLLEFPVS